MKLLRRLFRSGDSTPPVLDLDQTSGPVDFIAYLQVENSRLRNEVDELRAKLEKALEPRPRAESVPPPNVDPVGRKVYLRSQLREKASKMLAERYRKEGSDAQNG